MIVGVITTDSHLQRVLTQEIERACHQARIFRDLLQALAARPGLVFAQWPRGERLADFLAGLRAALEATPLLPVVVLVPPGALTLMRRAKDSGAADALFLPPEPEEIRAEIEEAARITSAADIAVQDKFRELRRDLLIGEAMNFIACLDDLKKAARCDANVLLMGETGTGKEMFAQALHELSRRRGNPRVSVNCASIPSTLLEAELFGHAKGAFTGADSHRAGRFEAAGAGTLLLDEIGEVDITFQAKLLRAIEQRVFQRLGENRDLIFNAKLICATAVDLDKAVDEKRFRRDLLGRIDQLRIVLPPLRERGSDVPMLARHFLRKHAKGRLVEMSKSAIDLLENYDFPGNIRDLENAIRGALARSDPGRLILPKHLPKEMTVTTERRNTDNSRAIGLPEVLSYEEAREYVVRTVDMIYLNEMLTRHGGNRSRAAKEAGIDRKTLSERLHEAVQQEGASDE